MNEETITLQTAPPSTVKIKDILGAYRVASTVHVMMHDNHLKVICRSDEEAHANLVDILKATGQAPIHEYK